MEGEITIHPKSKVTLTIEPKIKGSTLVLSKILGSTFYDKPKVNLITNQKIKGVLTYVD